MLGVSQDRQQAAAAENEKVDPEFGTWRAGWQHVHNGCEDDELLQELSAQSSFWLPHEIADAKPCRIPNDASDLSSRRSSQKSQQTRNWLRILKPIAPAIRDSFDTGSSELDIRRSSGSRACAASGVASTAPTAAALATS